MGKTLGIENGIFICYKNSSMGEQNIQNIHTSTIVEIEKIDTV